MFSMISFYLFIDLFIPFSAAEYGKLPLIKPYLHPGFQKYTDGANFASAGAGALSETRQGSVCDIYFFLWRSHIISDYPSSMLRKKSAVPLMSFK